MIRRFNAPLTYLQGKGTVTGFIDYAKGMGGNTLIFTDRIVNQIMGEKVDAACKESEIDYNIEIIEGGCTFENIELATKLAKEHSSRMLVGIGGGTVLDVARAAAAKLGCMLVLCPTTASQNAPFSKISIVNDEHGHMKAPVFVPFPPHLVVADTDIIVKAPVRLLKSGIADALSTLIEFQEVSESASSAPLKTLTNTAKYLNKGLYEVVFRDAEDAVLSCENNIATESFENIVETIYFSVCAGTVSLSHSLYEGFRLLKECDGMMHGEIIAFCSLVQLVVTDKKEQFKECIDLYRKLGLPTKLEHLGINRDLKDEEYEMIVNAAFKSQCFATWVRDKTVSDIIAAIKFVDIY